MLERDLDTTEKKFARAKLSMSLMSKRMRSRATADKSHSRQPHRPGDRVLSKRLEHLGDDALGVKTCLGVHDVGRVLIDENVGQYHGTELDAAVEGAGLREGLQDVGPEPADRTFLDCDHDFVLAREPQHEVDIERLRKPRIGHGCRQAEAGKLIRCLETFAETRAVAQERDLISFAKDAPAADLQRLAFA